MLNFKKRQNGDAHVYLIGLVLTFLLFVGFIIGVRIFQINHLYNEMEDGMTSALLSSAVINRDKQTTYRQIVVQDLSKFNGSLDKDKIITDTDDVYLRNAIDIYKTILEHNFYLDENYIPQNVLVDTSVRIVKYDIYNYFKELSKDGKEYTGNFRICKYSYDPENDNWQGPVVYDPNEEVYIADSLTQENVKVEGTTIVSQLELTTETMPFLEPLLPKTYDESAFSKKVYYQRIVDIFGNQLQIT